MSTQTKKRPMGLDLSGLATEKLSRSEAIDLMIDEAKESAKTKIADLEAERTRLGKLSADDLKRLAALDCVTVHESWHSPVVQIGNGRNGDPKLSVSMTLNLPDDLSSLPTDLYIRFSRLQQVVVEREAESTVERSLHDKSRVRTVLLRGMLGESAEGKALLKQLGDAATRFRETVRGKERRLLNR